MRTQQDLQGLRRGRVDAAPARRLGHGHADHATGAVQGRRARETSQGPLQRVGATDLGPDQHRLGAGAAAVDDQVLTAQQARGGLARMALREARMIGARAPAQRDVQAQRHRRRAALGGQDGRVGLGVDMDLGRHAAPIGDHDRGLLAAVDHVAGGQPGAVITDREGRARAGLGLVGHLDHDRRVERRGRPQRQPLLARHRRRRRRRVGTLLPADGDDHQGADRRGIDQPIGKLGEMHCNAPGPCVLSRPRRRRGSGRWPAWRRPAGRRPRSRLPGYARAGPSAPCR